MTNPPGIRLGIVRGISYGVFGKPDAFVPQIRSLGGSLVRVYFYWNQIEPTPSAYEWKTVDAFLDQLDGTEEVWVTVCSSSLWATEAATDFLPPSPAKDSEAYARFIFALVKRCSGRVAYWQCNNEPSNTGLLWTGSAEQYVAQLLVFQRQVRAADPASMVVLGGCGYDVLSSPADSAARKFFDHVVDRGRDAFDLFSVHLYDDPLQIPAHIQAARDMMRSHGYERPIVVGEYNGPTLFEFPEAGAAMQQTMAEAFSSGALPGLSSAELAVQVESPDRRAMRSLYTRIATLPPQLQMFMEGCPAELRDRRHRINCREIVTRNLLALSCGVTRTACWSLGPEVANYQDKLNLMGFFSGKLMLMDYEDGQLRQLYPAARTFRLLAQELSGATGVSRMSVDDDVELLAFDVQRPDGRG
jgi:hypothetical protein